MFFCAKDTIGLYHKNILTIVTDDRKWRLYHKMFYIVVKMIIVGASRVVRMTILGVTTSLSDDCRVVIYNRNMFMIQARAYCAVMSITLQKIL